MRFYLFILVIVLLFLVCNIIKFIIDIVNIKAFDQLQWVMIGIFISVVQVVEDDVFYDIILYMYFIWKDWGYWLYVE